MKIVILCGGRGTRLGLGEIPKPMVRIDGVPLLERLVAQAVAQGLNDFLFLAGHGSSYIIDHFGNGARWNATIEHVVESAPMGSAGCFHQVRDRLTAPFLVLYGDVLHDVDLVSFTAFAEARAGAATIFVHPNDHPDDSDLVEVDESDRVIAFHPKPHPAVVRLPNLVSAALYWVDPVALDYIPHARMSDWGHDVLPALAAAQPVFAYRSVEYAKDVGTPERRARAERHLVEGRVARLNRRTAKPALFLDRDGVINEERGGILRPDDVQLVSGAADAIHALNLAGIPVICVTNQPFLAKGQLTWAGMRAIGHEIDCQLSEAAGAYLDDVRICPHHPEAGWPSEVASLKIVCDCRKPAPGLLLDAAAFHMIDLERSWIIGDRYCDIVAGQRAGTRAALVRTGFGGSDRDSFDATPDLIAADLAEAVASIMDRLR